MGSKNSSTLFPENKHYSILDYGYCKVWKRNDTHKETMEQYNVSIQNQLHLNEYKKMWQLRLNQENIVGVYYFTHQNSEEFCGHYQKGSILTERIPYRLSQFCNIPYEEAITIIQIALQNYQILHLEYGLFNVRSTMLGVNQQNQLKVWIHTDFSSPEPENSNCSSLLDMLDTIIHAVEINADTPTEYIKFSQFIKVNRNKFGPTFDQMLAVLEIYRSMNHIPLAESLPRMSYFLRKAEGWQDTSIRNNNFPSNLVQVNSDSLQNRVLFQAEGSQKSLNSSKTVKNFPSSMNIYTHKQVNELMERQKLLHKNLLERQSVKEISKTNIAYYSLLQPQRLNNRITSPPPIITQRQSTPLRFTSTSPAHQQNKIQFKIGPQKRRSNTPINDLHEMSPYRKEEKDHPSNSSIEKRIPSPLPYRLNIQNAPSLSIYTHPSPGQQYIRKNRFAIETQNYHSSVINQQSVDLIAPLRAEY